jgi:hypothetical protein
MTWTALCLCGVIHCADGVSATQGQARSSVIYGQDDREEQCDSPVDSPAYVWARSSAMMVPTSALRHVGEHEIALAVVGTLSESMKASGRPLCSEERFQDEPVFSGVCSAFLVAPDVVVTAGHCVSAPGVCSDMAFVFGARYDRSVLAARVALLGVERGWGGAFVRSALRANFAEDRDVSAPAVLHELLAELGLDGPAVRAESESPEWKPRLRAVTERAGAGDLRRADVRGRWRAVLGERSARSGARLGSGGMSPPRGHRRRPPNSAPNGRWSVLMLRETDRHFTDREVRSWVRG